NMDKEGPARLYDGGGLWLYIAEDHSRQWVFQYRINGTENQIELGSPPKVTLQDARKQAGIYRSMKARGIDPIHHHKAEQQNDATLWTFDRCAEAYIEAKAYEWTSKKHAAQWRATIKTYCSPVFGQLPVDQIDVDLVLEVIEPLWYTKTETASRIRGRIENILSWAIVRGYHPGPNPAIWRGFIEHLLPNKNKIIRSRHHPSMPHRHISAFMHDLQSANSISAQALQFLILTAARTGEVIGASWPEIDLQARIWTIPANRMKAKRKHRVPLSSHAITLLDNLPTKEGWLFPSTYPGRHISNMAMLKYMRDKGYGIKGSRGPYVPHGFRSTFRDWCAEKTDFPRELAEAALAHTLRNKVEAAYQRSDLLEKRRPLMQAWADYCCDKPSQ
ncbi:tyrosine-type recombinase/integrase, partial [Thiolapillus sp.]